MLLCSFLFLFLLFLLSNHSWQCLALHSGITLVGLLVDHMGYWGMNSSWLHARQMPKLLYYLFDHCVHFLGRKGHTVIPYSSLLDPSHCTQEAEWSFGFPGSVCDASVSFHRLAFNKPSPVSLLEKDVVLSDSFGKCHCKPLTSLFFSFFVIFLSGYLLSITWKNNIFIRSWDEINNTPDLHKCLGHHDI